MSITQQSLGLIQKVPNKREDSSWMIFRRFRTLLQEHNHLIQKILTVKRFTLRYELPPVGDQNQVVHQSIRT